MPNIEIEIRFGSTDILISTPKEFDGRTDLKIEITHAGHLNSQGGRSCSAGRHRGPPTLSGA